MDIDDQYIIHGELESFQVKKVVVCAGAGTVNFANAKIKTSYAPIAVIEGVKKNNNSFVELDYFTKNCINLLTKGNGFGLAGGISLPNKAKCDEYLDYVVRKHKKINPTMKEVSRYVGVKTEITFKNQPRGYLYHIVNTDEGVWALIPGKFTLAFSLAPEFYRIVYKKNPRKVFRTFSGNGKFSDLIEKTIWGELQN